MNNRIKEQFWGFVKTPPLWNKTPLFGLTQFEFPQIKETDDFSPTYEIPELNSNFVLGKRMEFFFDHLLQHSEKYEVIVKNLQIFKGKITLGEIDFLIKDRKTSTPYHIELVYKFYLYDPSFKDPAARWIGPNRKDSLLQKISRLEEQQLPLLYEKETLQILNNYNLPVNEIEQQVCFKATLFLPKGIKQPDTREINTSCFAGYWIRIGDFTNFEYGDKLFHSPPKQDWPIDPSANEEWVTYIEIHFQIMELLQKKRSPLIWMRSGNNYFERFFVVWW
ncbi:DUF1853 family protein [Antarcticibacterium arcticum]|uniref:DUF1853 family protein n=1 Tax=Antarcticibacterium arcticum TaxID=2585771 RepID=A0A5B8YG33_9FLAO|nr:DUF1853 family protein [Antarcticibacterium arcticum]QED36885.1 DUF1853 family protein [Antarcticibacterium arcticum]